MSENKHTVIYDGNIVFCYGELTDDSNFEIICEDEADDMIWIEGNPNTGDFVFTTWEEVVRTLQPYMASKIEEITAV